VTAAKKMSADFFVPQGRNKYRDIRRYHLVPTTQKGGKIQLGELLPHHNPKPNHNRPFIIVLTTSILTGRFAKGHWLT